MWQLIVLNHHMTLKSRPRLSPQRAFSRVQDFLKLFFHLHIYIPNRGRWISSTAEKRLGQPSQNNCQIFDKTICSKFTRNYIKVHTCLLYNTDRKPSVSYFTFQKNVFKTLFANWHWLSVTEGRWSVSLVTKLSLLQNIISRCSTFSLVSFT